MHFRQALDAQPTYGADRIDGAHRFLQRGFRARPPELGPHRGELRLEVLPQRWLLLAVEYSRRGLAVEVLLRAALDAAFQGVLHQKSIPHPAIQRSAAPLFTALEPK